MALTRQVAGFRNISTSLEADWETKLRRLLYNGKLEMLSVIFWHSTNDNDEVELQAESARVLHDMAVTQAQYTIKLVFGHSKQSSQY